ncbi:hypothetical protein PYW07_016347 [Mythimna separata]|uniref:FP protein C-terminal domain-containing protein n=1 Tax=Mythimna separata TaxID=271217 RepID=A0AAD7YLH2_MYTSE|nr:hypothetical protein PYW07_016347 [Mythimna separata]
MSVRRTPPRGNSKLISPTQFGSDPALYTPESQQQVDLNIAKRSKRRLSNPSTTADISLSDLLTKMDEIKEQQDGKFTTLELSLKELTCQNAEINKSMILLSEKYDDVLSELKILQQENYSLKSHIKTLDAKIEHFEKGARSTMVELKNVPDTVSENKEQLVEIAKKIGNVINVPILDSDIRDISRLKLKDKTTGPIIVDFTSTIKREHYIKAAGSYNKANREKRLSTTNLNMVGPAKPIYVAESLPASIRRLHYMTRLFAKKHNYEHCWTSYGKVFLKRKEGQPRRRVYCEEDLLNMEKTI